MKSATLASDPGTDEGNGVVIDDDVRGVLLQWFWRAVAASAFFTGLFALEIFLCLLLLPTRAPDILYFAGIALGFALFGVFWVVHVLLSLKTLFGSQIQRPLNSWREIFSRHRRITFEMALPPAQAFQAALSALASLPNYTVADNLNVPENRAKGQVQAGQLCNFELAVRQVDKDRSQVSLDVTVPDNNLVFDRGRIWTYLFAARQVALAGAYDAFAAAKIMPSRSWWASKRGLFVANCICIIPACVVLGLYLNFNWKHTGISYCNNLISSCWDYEVLGRYASAKAEAERAVQLADATGDKKSQSYARYARGCIALKQGRHVDAISDMEKSIILDEKRTAVRAVLAEAYVAIGDQVNANRLLNQATQQVLAMNVDDPQRVLAIARIHIARSKLAKAQGADLVALDHARAACQPNPPLDAGLNLSELLGEGASAEPLVRVQQEQLNAGIEQYRNSIRRRLDRNGSDRAVSACVMLYGFLIALLIPLLSADKGLRAKLAGMKQIMDGSAKPSIEKLKDEFNSVMSAGDRSFGSGTDAAQGLAEENDHAQLTHDTEEDLVLSLKAKEAPVAVS